MAEGTDSAYEFAPQDQSPQTPAPAPSPEQFPKAPAQPVAERLCPHCGFRVFGKMAKNRCPDCAGDLTASDDLFQFSSPAWTRSIATGLCLLIPPLLLHCVAMTNVWLTDDKLPGAACHFVAALVAVIGAWMATTGEHRSNIPPLSTRWPVRMLALCSLAVSIAFLLSTAQKNPVPVMILAVINLISLAAFGLSIGLHIHALAMRMPNDSLAWWSQNLSWLIPLTALAQIPFNVLPRAKAEFLMLFMCNIPMAAGFTAVALAGAWTLLRAGLEMRTCATTAENIVIRRMKKQEADKTRPKR
jgi:hypothetical protein